MNRRKILSAAWRSSGLYAAGWKIHGFAPPPYDGFAFSRQEDYLLHETAGTRAFHVRPDVFNLLKLPDD
jgi:hypothetical protein